MIIDLILDRKDGQEYNPQEFYFSVKQYICSAGAATVLDITEAMESGNDNRVKTALISYVLENEYSTEVAHYILSQNWL